MPENATERPGSLVETHKGYDPRLLAFYPMLALLLLVLVGGLVYQQLLKADTYHEQERQQNQRRILIPGPRGNIYDREGRLLVGNRARFAVALYLDELRGEFRREFATILKNYRELQDKDIPSESQMRLIARYSVVQRKLDEVNQALGRSEKVDAQALNRHFRQNLLLPFVLIDDLTADEYAKLIEQLDVNSPLQVYATSTRYYPYNSAAAHTLGFVTTSEDIGEAENLAGTELKTFKLRGTEGAAGLERSFENQLQGETGGSIYRVDPQGFRIEPPLAKRLPVQGKDLVTSLDIDLQLAAEKGIEATEMAGSAVVMDVNTGEVLALASKPDFDLNDTSPRLKAAAAKKIEEQGAWLNRAVQGIYPPGSCFKIVVSAAGARHGVIHAESKVNCPGFYFVGNRSAPCHDRHAHHEVDLPVAIQKSCNVFFYHYGLQLGPDRIAAEARRFGLGQKTGIELPFEARNTLVPDPAWKKKNRDDEWRDGDTTNYSIGQGFLLVTPLQMAAFTASFARGETVTKPTLLRQADRTPQKSERLGLSLDDYAAIIEGMEQCVSTPGGTAHRSLHLPPLGPFPFRIAAKTGTAQAPSKQGTINFAWLIAFAPSDKPEIAMAICIEGDVPGEETGGGRYAGPVAAAIFKAWWQKKNGPSSPPTAAQASVAR
jgi:penicillin-binding protein 2